MADLRSWRPWYGRIPGTIVWAIGTVLGFVAAPFAIVGLAPFLAALWLMDLGLRMLRRPN